MKKWISLFLSFCMAFSFAISASAAENEMWIWDEENIPVWSDGEEISKEFYRRTEAVAAAAIVNTDSFVDRTADQTNFDVPAKAALLMAVQPSQAQQTTPHPKPMPSTVL